MYFEKPTGVGIYNREVWNRLYKLLDESGVDYAFYSYFDKGICAAGKQREIKLPFVFELIFKRFNSVHRLLWNIFYLPFIAKKFDLVYSFSTHGSPFVKNQIITIHDLICFQFPKQHRFQYLYFKYILPYILKACKKIVVVSEFTKQEVIKHYKVRPANIQVIFNGGDHLKTVNSYKDEKIKSLQSKIGNDFFLTVGASFKHKNVERLLHAMRNIPANLVIVGAENDYYRQLQKIAAEKNLNNIVFLSYVSSEVLSWLYKHCIANVYVSLYEGFGFPPLEAGMYHKVSILSNTSALKELYDGAAFFVDPYNVSDISNALKLFVSKGIDTDFYLQKLYSLMNKYRWEFTADGIFKLLTIQEDLVMPAKN